jgi:hypothetical protein
VALGFVKGVNFEENHGIASSKSEDGRWKEPTMLELSQKR